MRKKIRLYDNARVLPIKNFVNISETGNLKFLQPYDIEEPTELPKKKVKEAENIWGRILSEIKDLDVTLPALYLVFQVTAREIELELLQKRILELQHRLGKKKKEKKIKTYQAEKAFHDYISYLDSHYTDFQIDEVRPVKNFKEKFEKITGIKDEKLEKLFDIQAWYILDEYKFFLKQIPEKYHKILLSGDFLATFFRKKTIKIGKLQTIADYLAAIYKENEQYNNWIVIRASYFDLNNLNFSIPEAQKKQDIFDEIVRIENITGTRIDFENDTLAKLVAQRQLAQDIIKNRKKESQKK